MQVAKGNQEALSSSTRKIDQSSTLYKEKHDTAIETILDEGERVIGETWRDIGDDEDGIFDCKFILGKLK